MYDFVFVGLARDCAWTVPHFASALRRYEQQGLACTAFVGENGSTDSTRELLERSARDGLLNVIDTTAMAQGNSRLQRMALGRQLLAEHISDVSTRAVIVVDLDHPFLQGVSSEDLIRVYDKLRCEHIFGVAATSRPTFYDLLAFEDDTVTFSGLQRKIDDLKRHPLAYYRFFRSVIYPEQARLTSDSDIFCRSSFNGFAAYLADTYRLGSYIDSPAGTELCEHVTFNRSISRATGVQHMVIDGHLRLPMPPEHGERSFFGFVRQRLGRAATHWRRSGPRRQV